MDKRGISPLIATVLLIVFALVIAGIILSWGRGQVTEITEAAGEQVDTELACSTILAKIAVTSSTTGGSIIITNAHTSSADITGTYSGGTCTGTVTSGQSLALACVDAVAGPASYSLFITSDGYACGPITGTA